MLRIFIVSAIITAAVGLTFAVAGRADGHLFQATGTLKPDAQVLFPLHLKYGDPTTITATGNGKSDLDCYVLMQPEPGKTWHILALDESGKDSCSLRGNFYTDKPLKLWIRNNGKVNDDYSVVVDQ